MDIPAMAKNCPNQSTAKLTFQLITEIVLFSDMYDLKKIIRHPMHFRDNYTLKQLGPECYRSLKFLCPSAHNSVPAGDSKAGKKLAASSI
jgi:hypothetical protein